MLYFGCFGRGMAHGRSSVRTYVVIALRTPEAISHGKLGTCIVNPRGAWCSLAPNLTCTPSPCGAGARGEAGGLQGKGRCALQSCSVCILCLVTGMCCLHAWHSTCMSPHSEHSFDVRTGQGTPQGLRKGSLGMVVALTVLGWGI